MLKRRVFRVGLQSVHKWVLGRDDFKAVSPMKRSQCRRYRHARVTVVTH